MNDPGFLGSAETGVSSSLAHNKYLPGETAVHVPQALGKEGEKPRFTLVWSYLFRDPGEDACWSTVIQPTPVPLVEQPRISPSRVFSRLLEAAVLTTSLQACPPAGPSAPVWLRVCTAVGACSWKWAALMGLKCISQGLAGRVLLPEGCCPAHPHWICQKCSSASWNIPQFTAYTLVSLFTFLWVISPAVGKDEILVSVSNPLCGHFRSSEVVRGAEHLLVFQWLYKN